MTERARWKVEPKPAIEQARMREAARRIANGEHVVPLACGWCDSPSITLRDQTTYECLSCGRLTKVDLAHTLRFQKIRAYISKGVDVPAIHHNTRRPRRG